MMDTYLVTGVWGPMTVTEAITVSTSLPPEDEINFAENEVLSKWGKILGVLFVANADEITTQHIS